MFNTRGRIALAVLALSGLSGMWGRSADAVTLDTLLGSGSFTVGNATYSNFVYGGATSAATVDVNATTLGGTSTITFTRTLGNWTELDGNSVISYHIDFATPITTLGLDFNGTTSGLGMATVGETFTEPGLISHTIDVHTGFIGTNALSTSYNFGAPVSSLDVVKSIDTSAFDQQATSTVFSVDNTYTTVPEPASLAVLGLGAVALLRRRK